MICLKICRLPAVVIAVACLTSPGLAATCAEEIPGIKAEVEAMPNDADKNVAEKQLSKAQERHEQGKERSCLRFLESARAAIEAEQMKD